MSRPNKPSSKTNQNECGPGSNPNGCQTANHLTRRSWLHSVMWGSACWMTPMSQVLGGIYGENAWSDPRIKPAQKSEAKAKRMIVVWLNGAASQLETFDPHPGAKIAAGSQAIKTNVKGIQLSENLPQLAEVMDQFSIVRSVTSEEGDHERAIKNIKTGFRPEPTLVHPSIGSVLCHYTKNHLNIDIPRHISILANEYSGRGGYLGAHLDAFKTYDPSRPVPDVKSSATDKRFKRRIEDLAMMNSSFNQGRLVNDELKASPKTIQAAQKMMSSEQLKAFDVTGVPVATQNAFGNTSFGRSCISAIQLVQSGVTCVEIHLDSWDSHANNHEVQKQRCKVLDPAVASLLKELKARDLLDSTLVMVAGEFGRTPKLNLLEGRDHWPHGFSIALAGGGIQGGRVIGETSPDPKLEKGKRRKDLADPHPVENIHATLLHQMGIDFQKEIETPIGRPLKISTGKVIKGLI